MFNREKEWVDFSEIVQTHIREYACKQYGDSPTDQCEHWTVDDCLTAVKKYIARHGSNAREGQDLLDIVKMAHYICLAYHKYQKEDHQIEQVWQLKDGTLYTNDQWIELDEDLLKKNISPSTKRIIIEVKNDSN